MERSNWADRWGRVQLPLGLAYLAILIVGLVYFASRGELNLDAGRVFIYGVFLLIALVAIVQGWQWRKKFRGDNAR